MLPFTSFISLISFFALNTIALSAHAIMTLGESAEILAEKKYQFGLEPQLFLNEGGGANLGAFFDTNLNESSSLRMQMSTGKVDFNTLVTYKFIPFPDVDQQPAMGFRTGLGLSRQGSENSMIVHFAPLLSKKVTVQEIPLIPYASAMFHLVNAKSETYVASQMVGGTEFSLASFPEARFSAEVGFSLSRSYSYISATVAIPFDRVEGIKKR